MKDYQRQYPSFSLCGLFCGLCPIHHMENGCPGCGGGDGHQPCAVIRCGREHGGPEFCCDCPAYPCERYLEPPLYDQLLPSRNARRDLDRLKAEGLPAFRAELDEKTAILRELLARYNDGRRKTLFCVAVNLLPLSEVRRVMERLAAEEASPGGPGDPKARAELAAGLFRQAASEGGIELKLPQKPRRTEPKVSRAGPGAGGGRAVVGGVRPVGAPGGGVGGRAAAWHATGPGRLSLEVMCMM